MRVVLLGHPVSHSVSPAMQNAGFAALGLPHRYEAIDVPPEAVKEAVGEVRDDDYLGANVTVPHKLAVVAFMDELDETARLMGAVNTVVTRAGRLAGYNTDIEGAWKGLVEPTLDTIDGARVVIAGAGGASRAAIGALSRTPPRAPAEVVVVARTAAAAEAVAELGAGLGLATRAAAWPDLDSACDGARVLVNCTPMGLHGEDPFPNAALAGRAVLDLAYAPGGTALVGRALREGAAHAIQGDQMLLHQAVVGFNLWTGTEAPVEAMRLALAEALA